MIFEKKKKRNNKTGLHWIWRHTSSEMKLLLKLSHLFWSMISWVGELVSLSAPKDPCWDHSLCCKPGTCSLRVCVVITRFDQAQSLPDGTTEPRNVECTNITSPVTWHDWNKPQEVDHLPGGREDHFSTCINNVPRSDETSWKSNRLIKSHTKGFLITKR